MSRRIRTGFHRIGVVLAAPHVVLSFALAYTAWKDAQPSEVGPWTKYRRGAEPKGANPFDRFDEPAKPGSGLPEVPPGFVLDARPTLVPVDRDPFAAARPGPDFTIAYLAAAAALAAYAASWALGWIISG